MPLLASVVAVYLAPHDVVLGLPIIGRIAWTLAAVPVPIFFAGIIFSTSLARSTQPATMLGANLIGAVLGGFCEYLGMVTGDRFLAVIVIAGYGTSWLCQRKAGWILTRSVSTPWDH